MIHLMMKLVNLKLCFIRMVIPIHFLKKILNKFLNPEMPKVQHTKICVVFKIPIVGDHHYNFGKKNEKSYLKV